MALTKKYLDEAGLKALIKKIVTADNAVKSDLTTKIGNKKYRIHKVTAADVTSDATLTADSYILQETTDGTTWNKITGSDVVDVNALITTALAGLNHAGTQVAGANGYVKVGVAQENGKVTEVTVDDSGAKTKFDAIDQSIAALNATSNPIASKDVIRANVSDGKTELSVVIDNGLEKVADSTSTGNTKLKVKVKADSGIDLTADGLALNDTYVSGKAPVQTVTLEKLADATAGSASTYQLKVNGTAAGDKIEIIKDQFLKAVSYETTAKSGEAAEGVTFPALRFEWELPEQAVTYVSIADLGKTGSFGAVTNYTISAPTADGLAKVSDVTTVVNAAVSGTVTALEAEFDAAAISTADVNSWFDAEAGE